MIDWISNAAAACAALILMAALGYALIGHPIARKKWPDPTDPPDFWTGA